MKLRVFDADLSVCKVADAGIGIFAVSTFNTDYVLVKATDLARALDAFAAAGFDE